MLMFIAVNSQVVVMINNARENIGSQLIIKKAKPMA
jgi:hypothetical protein